MRLRQIKLAGFKSFADPALIELEHPVVGIVGPNGCGKSNIIDAVRWVLGEARVSELRGSSSMRELIFAGSTTRHALGRASVELILTNDDGRLKGAWSEFGEISVKRVVTAEGQSAYYINHQQVRRRDVQEIFLGTGLGPRSYAIISQGMISNFIRAKPEEMRVYLEEAAGVSLYRERRRETESLLSQTRGNLERVRDMQAVKEEEAARLEGEAQLAGKWRALTDERNAAESLWYWIQYEDVKRTLDGIAADIARGEAEIEVRKADAAREAASLPALESAAREAEAKELEAAAGLRQAERALTKAEAEERRQRERRAGAERAAAEAREAKAAKERRLAETVSAREAQASETDELEETIALSGEEEAAAQEEVLSAEDALNDVNARAAEARRAESDAKAQARVAHARLEAAERRAEDLRQRLLRLAASEGTLEAPDKEGLEAMKLDFEEAQAAAEEARALEEEAAEAAAEARRRRDAANEAYFAALAQEKETAAKLDALEAVEAGAQAKGRLAEFEAAEGLDGLPRLSEALSADPEWVTAVEAVVGSRLGARFLSRLGMAQGYESRRPPAAISFVERGETQEGRPALELDGVRLEPITSHVRCRSSDATAALADVAANVYCVKSLSEGLALRARLPEGVTLVTPKGDRLTSRSLVVWTASDPGQSVLSRQQEISALRDCLHELEDRLGKLDDDRNAAGAAAEAAERTARTSAQGARAAEAGVADLRLRIKAAEAAVAAHETRLADLRRSREELEAEGEEARALAEEAGVAADEAEAASERAVRAAAGFTSELARADMRFKTKTAALAAVRHKAELARAKLRQLSESARLYAQSEAALRSDIAREEARLVEASRLLEESAKVLGDAASAAALKVLEEAERAHAARRDATAAARLALTEAQGRWQAAQADVMPMTEALGVKRVEQQMKESLRTQFEERLDELKADRTDLARRAAERPQKAQSLRAKVLRLISEIAGLGPVNHAALEHLEAVRRTLEATARQVEDLEKGIETLEAAIRKIDAETRGRLRETFEEVNGHFAETFSELFGGGVASLVMSGDDVLNAGVEVKAQPPGKKNAGVKLLSGGAQALAATALVFAIFRLNPAPFCLLDEVDAPLDEANQARLAGLCRRMSSETQFLMITHHRVTMEFAGALVGVTMKEPGVSRVVSVDIENAVRMAN